MKYPTRCISKYLLSEQLAVRYKIFKNACEQNAALAFLNVLLSVTARSSRNLSVRSDTTNKLD